MAVRIFFRTEAQTVIGGLLPDPSVVLDMQSTSKGVLFPRLDNTARDAITSLPRD